MSTHTTLQRLIALRDLKSRGWDSRVRIRAIKALLAHYGRSPKDGENLTEAFLEFTIAQLTENP